MEQASPQRAARGRGLTALAALAAWATVVPWFARAVGAELDVPTRLEVIDHVVPGAIVLACCAFLVATPAGALARPAALGVAALAGFWITTTHAVLVPEAIDGISPWPAALLHLSAGVPLTVLALWLLLRL